MSWNAVAAVGMLISNERNNVDMLLYFFFFYNFLQGMHHETQSTHFAADANFAEANLEDTITIHGCVRALV